MSVKHEKYHDNYRLYIFLGVKSISDLPGNRVGGIGKIGGLGLTPPPTHTHTLHHHHFIKGRS